MKLLSLVVVAFILANGLAMAPAFATKGTEGGNGGSVVIDGKTYQIADLHFVPQDFGQFQFDSELKTKLKSFQELLDKHFFGTTIALDQERGSIELFDREVFNPLIEYRLVSKLPSDCTFIPAENLPLVTSAVPIACTKGKLTFILPDYFSKLDLQQQALLIVHERMHALFPSEPYELKVDVIKALYVLTGRYQAALIAGDTSFRFTDEEYDSVRILPYRLNQLYGQEHVKWTITREGGVANEIQGDNIHIDITSQVSGEVQGQDIWIQGSIIGGSVRGRNLSIQGSTLEGNVSNSSDISLSTVFGKLTLTGSSQVTIKDAKAPKFSINHLTRGRIENVNIDASGYAPQSGGLSIADSSEVVLTHLKRELPPNQKNYGSLSITVKGARIQISDTTFDDHAKNIHVLPGCCCFGVATRSQYEFKGDDLDIQNSKFGFIPGDPASCEVSVQSQVSGSAIHLNSVELNGAEIEGNQMTLNGVTFNAALENHNHQWSVYNPAKIKGSRVLIDSSVKFSPGAQINLEDVRLEKLSIQGFNWKYSALKNVQISDVHLVATQPDSTLQVLEGTQIKNIQELISDRNSVTFGKANARVALDGAGLRFYIRKAPFLNREIIQITSQEELMKWVRQ
jgi:hypothetical protein